MVRCRGRRHGHRASVVWGQLRPLARISSTHTDGEMFRLAYLKTRSISPECWRPSWSTKAVGTLSLWPLDFERTGLNCWRTDGSVERAGFQKLGDLSDHRTARRATGLASQRPAKVRGLARPSLREQVTQLQQASHLARNSQSVRGVSFPSPRSLLHRQPAERPRPRPCLARQWRPRRTTARS